MRGSYSQINFETPQLRPIYVVHNWTIAVPITDNGVQYLLCPAPNLDMTTPLSQGVISASSIETEARTCALDLFFEGVK